MSYEILRRNPGRGTIVVRYDDGRKVNLRLPAAAEGTPAFDAEVMGWGRTKNSPDWPAVAVFCLSYGTPHAGNRFKRAMPIHDRRR